MEDEVPVKEPETVEEIAAIRSQSWTFCPVHEIVAKQGTCHLCNGDRHLIQVAWVDRQMIVKPRAWAVNDCHDGVHGCYCRTGFDYQDMCPECRDEPGRDKYSWCICPPDDKNGIDECTCGEDDGSGLTLPHKTTCPKAE